MKLSQWFHVMNIIVGFAGIIVAIVAVFIGPDDVVWGLTREHWLLCSGLLMLIAIWIGISTIHHVLLEKEGRMM